MDPNDIGWWENESLLKLQSPCSIIVAAPSKSGKTYLVKQILEKANGIFQKPVSFIYYHYAIWQPMFTTMENEIKHIKFRKGIPNESDFEELSGEHTICVIDDLMDQASESMFMQSLFTLGSHHMNLTVIYIVQNLYQKGKMSKSIRLNSDYYILFENRRDNSQINCLSRQLFPQNTKYMIDAYNRATKPRFGYLFIDLFHGTNKLFYLRSRILPGEDTIIYTKKDEDIKTSPIFLTISESGSTCTSRDPD